MSVKRETTPTTVLRPLPEWIYPLPAAESASATWRYPHMPAHGLSPTPQLWRLLSMILTGSRIDTSCANAFPDRGGHLEKTCRALFLSSERLLPRPEWEAHRESRRRVKTVDCLVAHGVWPSLILLHRCLRRSSHGPTRAEASTSRRFFPTSVARVVQFRRTINCGQLSVCVRAARPNANCVTASRRPSMEHLLPCMTKSRVLVRTSDIPHVELMQALATQTKQQRAR